MVSVGERYRDYAGDICKVRQIHGSMASIEWESREGMVGEIRCVHVDILEDTLIFRRLESE